MFVVVAAQEFVALDGRHNTDGALVTWLRALNASQATYPNRPGECYFIREGQQDFDRRTFLYIFRQKEIDPAGADVSGLRAGLSHRRTSRPADGERKAHLKALCRAAFGPSQSGASSSEA